MDIYNSNLLFLLDQRKITISEFERDIAIPKIRINDPQPAEMLRISDFFSISLDILLRKDLRVAEKVRGLDIRFVALDVDGTLTDGKMNFTENGDQFKSYSTKDGLGIVTQMKKGTQFGIISHGRKPNMILNRAELLGIKNVYVGEESKLTVLTKWSQELGIPLHQCAFVGDDVNDLDVIAAVGLSACPADASDVVKKKIDIILSVNGGQGCVREFIDEWLAK